MTRWQETPGARQPFMMLPTARAARGTPAAAATSPYVATRPGGIRRTAARTRPWKCGNLEMTKSPDGDTTKSSDSPVSTVPDVDVSEEQPQPASDLRAPASKLIVRLPFAGARTRACVSWTRPPAPTFFENIQNTSAPALKPPAPFAFSVVLTPVNCAVS